MTDHAPYVHAVADCLDRAGFFVMSVGGHDWAPRGGHIRLGCQDGWDRYDWGDADLLWDVAEGWRLKWGGLTRDLPVRVLSEPNHVAAAVGDAVGQMAHAVGGYGWGEVDAADGTPEFDAFLARYVTERTPL